MKLLLVNQSKERAPRAWLGKWVKALSRELKKHGHKTLGGQELVIVFVDSREMKRLNKLYRGKDYATDVLSFEAAEPGVVGELVLCGPVIRKQSQRTGLSARGELGYMVVHGVLHLLGLDHETPSEEARMFALQDEVFARLRRTVGLR